MSKEMNDSEKLHKAAKECLEEAFRTHKCPLCQGPLIKPDEAATGMEKLGRTDSTCEMAWMRPKEEK